MRKIENIIDSCIDCMFCEKYIHEDINKIPARICTRVNPCRLAGFDGPKHFLKIPDWCPLETYEEAEQSESRPETAPCNIGQSKSEEKARDTIILPGLPNLEWMTENLTGFGGTEVDGRWYYTYDEVVEAVKQLGNGWRLPKPEERKVVADLGSEWQENGPHRLSGRLFGGGLFLEAAGVRHFATGALSYVGTWGIYWVSSSSHAAGDVYEGCLGFDSDRVCPDNNSSCEYGLSVRCVRNVK